jgi:membrane protein DedA with SNARE-associated domain
MDIFASHVANLLYEHRYIFTFLGAIFEGTYIMILAGVMYKFGYLNFWGTMGVLMVGYMLNGLMYYLIGFLGGHKILEKTSKKFRSTRNALDKLEGYFQEHSAKALFITRITWGVGIPVLIMSGSFRMKLKKFLYITFVATIIWVAALFGVGYAFGASYKALGVVTETITIALTIVIFVAIILFSFLLVHWIRKFAETKFIQKVSEHHESSFLRWLATMIRKLAKKTKT